MAGGLVHVGVGWGEAVECGSWFSLAGSSTPLGVRAWGVHEQGAQAILALSVGGKRGRLVVDVCVGKRMRLR